MEASKEAWFSRPVPKVASQVTWDGYKYAEELGCALQRLLSNVTAFGMTFVHEGCIEGLSTPRWARRWLRPQISAGSALASELASTINGA